MKDDNDKIETLSTDLLATEGAIKRNLEDLEKLLEEVFKKREVLARFVQEYEEIWQELLKEKKERTFRNKHTGLYSMPTRIIMKRNQIIFEDGSTKF